MLFYLFINYKNTTQINEVEGDGVKGRDDYFRDFLLRKWYWREQLDDRKDPAMQKSGRKGKDVSCK